MEDPPLAAAGSNQPASGRPGAVHGEKKREVGEAVPYGRMGRPEDHAGAAVFLACSDSDYVVAQTLNVDGGNWMS
ncbi:MAG TPA: SDR family oxidoreductase [Geminicoccaceae bacterium]|nr:SDR family oxidoreductase [Geminicoccaceae bacterium]